MTSSPYKSKKSSLQQWAGRSHLEKYYYRAQTLTIKFLSLVAALYLSDTNILSCKAMLDNVDPAFSGTT